MNIRIEKCWGKDGWDIYLYEKGYFFSVDIKKQAMGDACYLADCPKLYLTHEDMVPLVNELLKELTKQNLIHFSNDHIKDLKDLCVKLIENRGCSR